MSTHFIPEGMTSVTPHIIVENCAKAIEWYTKVFGAKELFRMDGPGGKIMHAQIMIGNAQIMLVDAFPEWNCNDPKTIGDSSVVIHLYVEDTDALFAKAVGEGATSLQEPNDAFWGDRFSKIKDPFGHLWSIATKIKDISPEEMKKAQEEWAAAQHK